MYGNKCTHVRQQMYTCTATNQRTKENVLNQIDEIENNVKTSINTEINLRETRAIAAVKQTRAIAAVKQTRAIAAVKQTRAIAALKQNPKYFHNFVKKQLNDQGWNLTSPG